MSSYYDDVSSGSGPGSYYGSSLSSTAEPSIASADLYSLDTAEVLTMGTREGLSFTGSGDWAAGTGGTSISAGATTSASSSSLAVEEQRHIKVNDPGANVSESDFCMNDITTSTYTKWDFLPKNLWAQLHKTANIYFTCMTIIQLVPGLSPVNIWSSVLPLLFVLAATAVREALEDYKRHRSDAEINARDVYKVSRTHKKLRLSTWEDIAVGDIVKVSEGEFCPADLLVLAASGDDGTFYIETSNLDGETNLKLKAAVRQTYEVLDDVADLAAVRGDIFCEPPNERLYKFRGYMRLTGVSGLDEKKDIPLSNREVMLRGTQLRNTRWLFGIAVFTGHDTKLMQNTFSTGKIKRSNIDILMNNYLLIILAFLFTTVFLAAVLGGAWHARVGKIHPYLAIPADESSAVQGIKNFFTFLILFSALIPISLYVSVEMVKVGHALFIDWDIDMYEKDTDTPAKARTSNLSEELGQIEYIFSDKTGTLTMNQMDFLKCTIGKRAYGNGTSEAARAAKLRAEGGEATLFSADHLGLQMSSSEASDYDLSSSEEEAQRGSTSLSDTGGGDKTASTKLFKAAGGRKRVSGDRTVRGFTYDAKLWADMEDPKRGPRVREFLLCLALCNGVQISTGDDGEIAYQAASPDEGALVTAAANFGYKLVSQSPQSMTVEIQPPSADHPTTEVYELLDVLEFTSTRKRMSVIYRTPEGKIKLYAKGADNVMYERLAEDGNRHADRTLTHLDTYAVEGLRTLVLASRELSDGEYEAWSEAHEEAKLDIQNRAARLASVYEEIEKEFVLIGCTAIEDKLQTGVPDAIATLAKAGIKIWVLTGDKQETAINIGFACALLTHKQNLIVCNATSPENTVKQMRAFRENFSPEALRKAAADDATAEIKFENALIMDGQTLQFALEDAYKRDQLFDLASECTVAIFCRVSPKQKSEVVRVVRDRDPRITLAIGDGANDVAMIKEAHVGVGISGQEGMQAVLASDYAIGQFRFLRSLLLTHGRWSYKRVCQLILYSFYKNFAFNLTQLWFNIYAGFSGQTILDDWYISLFNLLFTGLPIMVLALFDQDVSARSAGFFPQIYRYGPTNLGFNRRKFILWLVDGTVQSLVLFFLPYFWFAHITTHSNGRMDGLDFLGSAIYACIVVACNAKIAIMTHYWTVYNAFMVVSNVVFFFGFALVYHGAPGNLGPNHAFTELIGDPGFWLMLVATTMVCILPAYVYECMHWIFFPSNWQIIREFKIPSDHSQDLKSLKSFPNIQAALENCGNMRALRIDREQEAEARRVEGARNLLAHLALAGDGKKNFQVKFRGGA